MDTRVPSCPPASEGGGDQQSYLAPQAEHKRRPFALACSPHKPNTSAAPLPVPARHANQDASAALCLSLLARADGTGASLRGEACVASVLGRASANASLLSLRRATPRAASELDHVPTKILRIARVRSQRCAATSQPRTVAAASQPRATQSVQPCSSRTCRTVSWSWTKML